LQAGPHHFQRREANLRRQQVGQRLAGTLQRGRQRGFGKVQAGKQHLDPGQVGAEQRWGAGIQCLDQIIQVVAGVAHAFGAAGRAKTFPNFRLLLILAGHNGFGQGVGPLADDKAGLSRHGSSIKLD
jgi:hypothetical protein